MEKIFLDLTEMDKVSAIKDTAREALINDLMAYLQERCEDAGLLASNRMGVVIGCASDEDGFSKDIVAEIKVSIKPWYNKLDCKRPVRSFDLHEGTKGEEGADGVDAYMKELEAKKNKAPKK